MTILYPSMDTHDPLEFIPDFYTISRRHEAWWHAQNERPIFIASANANPARPIGRRTDLIEDAGAWLEAKLQDFHQTRWIGDALPYLRADFGAVLKWLDELRKIQQAGKPLQVVCPAGEVLALWIEAGFNCCYPVEVAAGNDITAFRQQYGQKMAYLGGIDKRALAKGGDAMHTELLRVVPPLLELGGFIPTCDHGVPPDISWPNFIEYARYLAQLTGWLDH